jgi:adenine deaminase
VSEVSSYLRIIRNEDEILERKLLARSLGKNVEGHTLGASYDR